MKVIRLGRAEDNDVVFQQDLTISAHHLSLCQVANGQWTAEDLHSTNGTFVNQKKIAAGKPVVLQPGDELRIGKTLVSWHQYTETAVPAASSLQKTQWMPAVGATLEPKPKQVVHRGTEALSWVFIGLVFFTILLLALAYWK
ncbi:MAG TPA: hypothetical protein DCM08_00330 [Microscillaceae bacterium]|jgi:predicted component of type VI protein secretion system|nr:hypothetical protein [Microscillaceae bacterium]